MARIALRVHPRAKRTGITARVGDSYKLDLAAPPANGKANAECLRFIAEAAGVPRTTVRIIAGAASRNKVIEVDGITQEALENRLMS